MFSCYLFWLYSSKFQSASTSTGWAGTQTRLKKFNFLGIARGTAGSVRGCGALWQADPADPSSVSFCLCKLFSPSRKIIAFSHLTCISSHQSRLIIQRSLGPSWSYDLFNVLSPHLVTLSLPLSFDFLLFIVVFHLSISSISFGSCLMPHSLICISSHLIWAHLVSYGPISLHSI